MSEEMILSGAFFDNSMPKWATEETMKRIGNDLKKDNAQSRKQHDKMILLLGKIVQNSNKEEKTQKETLKEIKSIAKEIKDSNKTNKELVKEVKKSNKLADEANKQAKKSTTGSAGSNNGGEVDTSEMEGHLLDVNKRLEDIYKIMKESTGDMIQSMENRNKMMGRANSIKASNAAANSSSVVRERSGASDDVLNDFVDKMEEQNRSRRGARGARISNEISPSRGTARQFNGRIMAMIGAIGTFVKRIRQFGSMILGVIKKIPLIGTKIAAAITAMGAVSDFVDTISSSLSDYKGMIDRGISFARANVEGIRMDGIMVRKMIGEAGLTLEAGTKAMQNNIAVLNDMGIEDYMTTIKAVMGNAQDSASFINRVMMSQNDIAEFSRDYLKSLKMMGDYERLNNIERVEGIQRFAKYSRMFAQMTGESIEEMRNILTDMASDPRTATYLAGISNEDGQRDETQGSLQLIAASFGKGSQFHKTMVDAITDPTGAGFAQTEMFKQLTILSDKMPNSGELLNQLQYLSKNLDTQTAEETSRQLMNVASLMQEGMSNMSNETSRYLNLMMKRDPNLESALGGLMQMQARYTNDPEAFEKILQQAGLVDDKSTDTVNLNHQWKTTAEQTEAAMQAMTANAANSEASRAAMETGYRVMIETNNLTEKGAQAAVTSAYAMVDYLPKISNYIYDILGIMDDDRKTRKQQADESMNTMDLGASARVQRDLLLGKFKAGGLATDIYNPEISQGRGPTQGVGNNLEKNMEKFENYSMGVESLIQQAQSSNDQVASIAREMMMYMGSKQMKGVLSQGDRAEYKNALEEIMGKVPEEQRNRYYEQLNQSMRTGTAAMRFQGMFAENFERIEGRKLNPQVENSTKGGNTESASGSEVETQRREAEEAENRNTEANGERRQGRNGNVTFNENNIPNTIARPNAGVDTTENGVNLINVLNDSLGVLNSQMDDLINLTKMGNDGTQDRLRDVRDVLGKNSGTLSS